MPGLLSRSKSMRLLKSHSKDTAGQDTPIAFVPSSVHPQTGADAFWSTLHNVRVEANIETPGMPVRPSTSGGSGERKAQFHMKTIFVPQVHSQGALAFSSTTELDNLSDSEDASQSTEGIIGIALGSPTAGSHWNSTPQATSMDLPATNTSSTPAPPLGSHNYQENPLTPLSSAPTKSKLSRWKSLFKKVGASEPRSEKAPFYQLTTTVTTITASTRATRADSHHDEESLDSAASSMSTEAKGRVRSPPTFKHDIRASRKHDDLVMPPPPPSPRTRVRTFTAGSLPINPRMSIQRSFTTPILLGQRTASSALPNVPQVVVSGNTPATQSASTSKPLLDVSIPDIKMERYSVMFGNLLQPTSNRSSSLLVRRQGNAEKLKPLNELSVKEGQESPMDYRLQRRATSPIVPSPSPRLSLFPNITQSRAASPRSSSVPRLRALHKCKAIPEKSPLNQVFHDAAAATVSPELIIQKPESPAVLNPTAPRSKLQANTRTPNTARSFNFATDSVTFDVDHTASLRTVGLIDRYVEYEICTGHPMIKPSVPSAPAMARKDSQTLPRVTKFSALSSNPASAPLDAPSPLQRISSMRSPPLSAGRASDGRRGTESSAQSGEVAGETMVGVARSVSVSKANSPRAQVRIATDLSSPERLVEKVTLTPTMVEVRNRRSQRVQLVDV